MNHPDKISKTAEKPREVKAPGIIKLGGSTPRVKVTQAAPVVPTPGEGSATETEAK